jgi:hypothetical protein
MNDKSTRWRVMVHDRPAGPWRESRAAAMRDAIDAGHAERDEQYGVTFLIVPAWLECEVVR